MCSSPLIKPYSDLANSRHCSIVVLGFFNASSIRRRLAFSSRFSGATNNATIKILMKSSIRQNNNKRLSTHQFQNLVRTARRAFECCSRCFPCSDWHSPCRADESFGLHSCDKVFWFRHFLFCTNLHDSPSFSHFPLFIFFAVQFSNEFHF